MNLSLSPWLVLALAVPVLLIGEQIQRRVPILSRFYIPAPVVGGLLVSTVFLIAGFASIDMDMVVDVTARWWTWIVTPEIEWVNTPTQKVYSPFLIGFFACIGLNAPWKLLRQAGWQLPLMLLIAATFIIIQNGIGISLAKVMGENPFLGLLCGSVSLTGGHGTALGFAEAFSEHGYTQGAVVGTMAATFGLVSGGLVGGPVANRLIQKYQLRSSIRPSRAPEPSEEQKSAMSEAATGEEKTTFFTELRALAAGGRKAWIHGLTVLLAIKAGSWITYGLNEAGLLIPVFMGAIFVGILIRNVVDAIRPGLIDNDIVSLWGGLCLNIFLTVALMSLKLADLATTAVPMLVILLVQAITMAVFARYITFWFMGRDYDAMVISAGHCGFGLGATPVAIANMKAVSDSYGPAPRAYLIVPLIGAFFIDFVNSAVVTVYFNWLI